MCQLQQQEGQLRLLWIPGGPAIFYAFVAVRCYNKTARFARSWPGSLLSQESCRLSNASAANNIGRAGIMSEWNEKCLTRLNHWDRTPLWTWMDNTCASLIWPLSVDLHVDTCCLCYQLASSCKRGFVIPCYALKNCPFLEKCGRVMVGHEDRMQSCISNMDLIGNIMEPVAFCVHCFWGR